MFFLCFLPTYYLQLCLGQLRAGTRGVRGLGVSLRGVELESRVVVFEAGQADACHACCPRNTAAYRVQIPSQPKPVYLGCQLKLVHVEHRHPLFFHKAKVHKCTRLSRHRLLEPRRLSCWGPKDQEPSQGIRQLSSLLSVAPLAAVKQPHVLAQEVKSEGLQLCGHAPSRLLCQSEAPQLLLILFDKTSLFVRFFDEFLDFFFFFVAHFHFLAALLHIVNIQIFEFN
mmetsp:Transcript_15996/g.22085  ORF Transcript_15996/g.22085 Transcript_15996/m.22085 type:complete len:227 (-) Transcript_15996:9-689(-)